MLNRTLAVALGTFRETVRDRLFYLVGFFGLALVGTTTVLSPLTVGAQAKIVADVGLASMSLLGVLVVLLVGASMVRKEMDGRTITTILTKPLGRGEYLLGKYLGLSSTLVCMVSFMAVIYAVAVAFTPATLTWSHAIAVYLTLLELLVLTAAAILCSFVAGPTLAAVLTGAFFVIGHLLRSLHDFATMADGVVGGLVSVLYRVLPDLEVFNVRAEAVHGDPIAPTQVALATVYGLGWIIVLLLSARVIFVRREL